MTREKQLKILRLKRRILELEQLRLSPRQWTSGELEIFRHQISIAKRKIINLSIEAFLIQDVIC